MHLFRKHPLMAGTMFLTASGLFARLIGFFYRIFLSRTFGSVEIGRYQLILPLLAISFSLTAAGFQAAVSKLSSESPSHSPQPLLTGLSVCTPLSLVVGLSFYFGSDFLASAYLKEPACAPMLRIMAFSIPFSVLHSCINGYLMGIGKPLLPALGQLFEQLVRVGSVFLLCKICTEPTVSLAVLGLTIGEIASFLFSCVALHLCLPPYTKRMPLSVDTRSTSVALCGMAFSLNANRLIINLLQSIEAGAIPAGLIRFGFERDEALSAFGTLTGMAMPFLLFPTAITGALSAMLIPSLSAEKAKGKSAAVTKRIQNSVSLSLALGFSCGIFFLLFGKALGLYAYQNETAGSYLSTLGFLCPFLYLNTTMSGVLQGLGKIKELFFINISSLSVRLIFVFFLIPRIGLNGFLYGIFIAQFLQTCLFFRSLKNTIKKQE